MGGRMLAIDEGSGYRPILTVQTIQYIPQLNARPASTILFGSQLLFQVDNPSGYQSFLQAYVGVATLWAQLRMATELSEEQLYLIWPKLPIELVIEQPISILAAGNDPVAGYWVQFPGTITLFSQTNWYDESDDQVTYLPPALSYAPPAPIPPNPLTVSNTFFDGLSTFLTEAGAGGVAGPQGFTGPTGPTGPAGAVGPSILWTGAWSPTANYVVGDGVVYGGTSYIAMASSINAEPDVTPASWSLFAAAGPTGATGASGASAALQVTYDNSSYPTVESALNFLLYVPIQVNLSSNQSTLELGVGISELTFTWTINKPVVSQSFDNNIGSVAPALRTIQENYSPNLTTATTWVLTVSDGTNTATASTSVQFLPKAYWGVSSNASVANADILAFASTFATGLARSISFNCTGGAYPYYCYPASFGLPHAVVIGGLSYSDYTVTVQSVTNASGYVSNYNVVKFNGIQTGSNIATVWS